MAQSLLIDENVLMQHSCTALGSCLHPSNHEFCHRQTCICSTCQAQLISDTLEDLKGQSCSSNLHVAQASNFKKQVPSINWGVVPDCNTCGYPVRGWEQLRYGSKVYHRVSCFKCKECGRLLDDATAVAQMDELYCRPCLNKRLVIASPNFCSSTKMTPCAACMLPCGSRPADLVDVGKLWFHRACCRCSNCHSSLDFIHSIEHEGRIYCRLCFIKRFAANLLADTHRPMTICVECGEEAQVHEYLRFYGNVYHMRCLKCSSCKERLTLTTYSDDNEKLFCRKCLSSTRHGTMSPAHKLGGCNEKCGACNKACYAAERVHIGKGTFHKGCLRCSKCKSPCSETTIACHENKLYCLAKCYKAHANLVTVRAKPAAEVLLPS